MSDQFNLEPGDSGDQDSFSIDDETQLSGEDQLLDRGVDDLLDEGYSPPERPREVESYGITAQEQHDGETIDMRLEEELPDDPQDEHDPRAHVRHGDDRVGGDDPDAIAAEDDFLGDPEVGDRRAGRLVAPDEGAHEDRESDLVAEDEGFSGGAASAEEAAVHVIGGDRDLDEDEDDREYPRLG
ncbi:hypothetical protein GGG17_11930 [Arsenicicoccus sp. MKL-02]|uniref:DUF5709 domain-containing protein n=1 Tax=Arsenicicoccus cauae TaxID=2663847 RepID=A0A6I3I8Y4_9MICO|nr:DUF5709 domain-containing protein [Arsenicicoccus cauae]MTB72664.1 hypothetical protein [Arsenicicoccus cauae]